MNLDLFNNILNSTKENNFIQNFIKELSSYLKKTDNDISNNIKETSLKQENCLYQVVEIGLDGAYLQNTNNNKVSKEQDIPKETLDKIVNDTVLLYKNGQYIVEEEITKKFFDNMIDVKEYQKIKNEFMKEASRLEIKTDTQFKIEKREKDYSILSYENNDKKTIKVPNVIVPFWAKVGENLYYKNGQFIRDIKVKNE